MKNQHETIAKLLLEMPEGPISQETLLRFGNQCYQAGFAHGAIKGQTHMANTFDRIFRAIPDGRS